MEFPVTIGSMHVDLCRDRREISDRLIRPDVRWKVGSVFAEERQMSFEPSERSLVSYKGPIATIPEDPWMLLETGVMTCAALCAADESGSAVMGHEHLSDVGVLQALKAFRNRTEFLLHKSHCVISGLNFSVRPHSAQPDASMAMAVREHIADITIPTSILADAGFREKHGWNMINGMAFAPRQLMKDDRNHLFLLNKQSIESVSKIVPGKRRKQ